jgi:hypothetical protein
MGAKLHLPCITDMDDVLANRYEGIEPKRWRCIPAIEHVRLKASSASDLPKQRPDRRGEDDWSRNTDSAYCSCHHLKQMHPQHEVTVLNRIQLGGRPLEAHERHNPSKSTIGGEDVHTSGLIVERY